MRPGFLFASLLFLASFLAVPPHALARNLWYVDGVHGNDNNNCKSRKTACKTIGHAISLASPDDAILVGSATYYENLTINFNLGIIGSGASTTIIDGQALNPVININDGHVILAGFTIRNGSSGAEGYAGGIQNYGIVALSDSIITRNVGDTDLGDCLSGGIFNGGTLTLNRTTVTQNETTFNYYSCGTGILNNGTMTINDSTVSDNVSNCAAPEGAGIDNGGALIINRSTISGNQTGEGAGVPDGGGISNYGTVAINNSTLYGNGTSGGVGGGIASEYGTVTINNSTISGNDAYYGGAGLYNVATVNIQNSIVSDNIVSDGTGGNCEGALTSEGYNLSSDNTCNLNGPGDLNNTEPKLGPLKNNGGPTLTLGELTGSPTIDAGNPNGCTDSQGHLLKTDQRGFPRPGKFKHDHRCDMGAFERQRD